MTLAILRGGAHDGLTTDVADEVTRVVTVSDAPGLLDVYELVETEIVEADDRTAVVFEFSAQEPAEGFAPELLHTPARLDGGVAGNSAHDVVVDPADLAAAESAAHAAGQDVEPAGS